MNRVKGVADLERPDFSEDSNLGYNLPFPFAYAKLPARHFLKIIRNETPFEFLRSKAGFNTDEDDAWLPHRLLGTGSFGQVGTWVKRDRQGNIVDEVAVKEWVNFEPNLRWNSDDSFGVLAAEAVIQKQLNLSLNENLVHLRGYKYFIQGESRTLIKRRAYQEYAAHGELFYLLYRYYYWHQYLPEPFLWHLLDSLTSAAVAMRDCSHEDLPHGDSGPMYKSDQIVNLDIKNENVFLGYPEHRAPDNEGNCSSYGGTRKYDYPVIKLGDFGLAHFTGPEDPYNPRAYLGVGGKGMRPPEQCFYGAFWPLHPNANSDFRLNPDQIRDASIFEYGSGQVQDVAMRTHLSNTAKFNFKLDQKTHVWTVAKLVFDIMTLVELFWQESTTSYVQFLRNGEHNLEDFNKAPFRKYASDGISPYSKELTDLLADCLRPLYAQRPDLASVKQRTAAGMQFWDDKWYPGCEDIPQDGGPQSTSHPKLFYRDHDICNMNEGTTKLKANYSYLQMIQEDAIKNPDLGPFQPPFSRYDRGATQSHWERWVSEWNETVENEYSIPRRTKFQKEFKVVDRELHRRSEFGMDDAESDPTTASTSERDVRPNDDDSGDDDADDSGDDHNFFGTSLTEEIFDQQPRSATNSDLGTVSPPLAISSSANVPASQTSDRVSGESSSGSSHRSSSNSSSTPPPAPPSPTTTADPDDSDYEIVRRRLRNGRRRSYYRLKRGRKRNDKELRHKVKQKREGAFVRAQQINAARRALQFVDQNRENSTNDVGQSVQGFSIAGPQIHITSPSPSQIRHLSKQSSRRSVRRASTTNNPFAINEDQSATENYIYAQAIADTGLIPPLPSVIDPSDPDFRWENNPNGPGAYITAFGGVLHWWDIDSTTQQGRWRQVDVWDDTPQNRVLGRVGLPRIRGG